MPGTRRATLRDLRGPVGREGVCCLNRTEAVYQTSISLPVSHTMIRIAIHLLSAISGHNRKWNGLSANVKCLDQSDYLPKWPYVENGRQAAF